MNPHTPDNPPRSNVRVMAGGTVWICALQFFAAQIIVQAVWTTPFSLATNYISDLGNTACANYPAGSATYVCSPAHFVMNVSFALQGIIIIAGSLLIRPVLRNIASKTVVFALLVLTGLGLIGVGAFPENVNNDAHVYSAGLQFVTGNLALVLAGLTRMMPGTRERYAVFSVLLGVVGLAATVMFPIGIHLGLGVGGMERVAAYTVPVWLIWTGILLVRRSSMESCKWED